MKTLLRSTALAITLLMASLATASSPPTYVGPNIPPLFGQYHEGQALVPQILIEQNRYLGFVHPQAFKPFYYEVQMPIQQLPPQFWCCILSPYQITDGHVRVIHVYLDPNPDDGRNVRAGFIGPIESWIPVKAADGADELISITAPYQGRRAKRAQ